MSIQRTRRNNVSLESNPLSTGCRGEWQGILGRIKELSDPEDGMINHLFFTEVNVKHFDVAAPIGCCDHRISVIKALKVRVSSAAARKPDCNATFRAGHNPRWQKLSKVRKNNGQALDIDCSLGAGTYSPSSSDPSGASLFFSLLRACVLAVFFRRPAADGRTMSGVLLLRNIGRGCCEILHSAWRRFDLLTRFRADRQKQLKSQTRPRLKRQGTTEAVQWSVASGQQFGY